MKPRGISILALGVLLSPFPARSHELGFLLGGGLEIKNAYDVFTVGPYYSTASPSKEPIRMNFFIPLLLSVDTEDNPRVFSPPPASSISAIFPGLENAYAIGVTPSLEIDIDLYRQKLFLSPLFGLNLDYQNIETFSGNSVNLFSLAVVPAMQIKAIVNERVVLRFSPFALSISPWRYGDNGIGSDAGMSVTYNLFGGASYLF
ncbi:MAG TPA: hypothetical protein VI895_02140 [Bdellovibrionota bacterium]|nr:hypothetical protein [Bdellovibrionota bacterium]